MRSTGVNSQWLAMVVVVSLIGASLPRSAVAQVPWPPLGQECTVTSTVSKPTGLGATVNPAGYYENGILVQWDAAPGSDQVYKYNLFRKKASGGTLIMVGSIQNVSQYHPSTGTYSYPDDAPSEILDPESSGLETGEQYIYRVSAARWNNCGDYQESEQSDPVTVTYEVDE